MSDETIKPALTPDAWRVVVFEHEENKALEPDFGRADGLTDEDDHATAARLLYGKPFGFTQEEVAVLREAIYAVTSHSNLAWAEWGGISIAKRAVEKIAALLPPPK